MQHRNFVTVLCSKKFWISFAAAALLSPCAILSGASNAATIGASTDPLILTTQHSGETYSFTDTIVVKWQVNTDSLNASNIHSYLKQFSLDSGKSWYDMTVKAGSEKTDSNKYQITWIGLDTTQLNDSTGTPFTKANFLNRGIKLKVVSYPPHSKTGYSDYIFFHDGLNAIKNPGLQPRQAMRNLILNGSNVGAISLAIPRASTSLCLSVYQSDGTEVFKMNIKRDDAEGTSALRIPAKLNAGRYAIKVRADAQIVGQALITVK